MLSWSQGVFGFHVDCVRIRCPASACVITERSRGAEPMPRQAEGPEWVLRTPVRDWAGYCGPRIQGWGGGDKRIPGAPRPDNVADG